MRLGNINLNAESVHAFAEPESRHTHIREAIRKHRAGERDPVDMGGSIRFLHSSGRRREILIYGPKCEPLENGDPCPECGYEFDHEEWDCREVAPGAPTAGQTWNYTCPRCNLETATVGT